MDSQTPYPTGVTTPPIEAREPTAAEEVATAIVDWRTSAKRSRKDVAAALSVDPSFVSRWETGTRVPTYDRIYQLAKFLGVSAEQRQIVVDKAMIARRALELAPCVRQHLAAPAAPLSDVAS